MTIVVGYLPAKGGRACLDLAAELARSGQQEDIAVITVIAQHWASPSMAKVDAELAQWAHQTGEQALDQARGCLAGKWPDVDASFHRAEGRSVPAAVTHACDEHSGDLLVLGSSADGRSDRSSSDPQPACSCIPPPCRSPLRPADTAPPKGAALTRLTCAYSGTADADDLLTATALMSARMGCALRIHRGTGRDLVVRHRRNCRRAFGRVLRRSGLRGPGVGIVVFLRSRHIGELPAMIVAGCLLLLDYGVSGAAVAVGWSQYADRVPTGC